MMPANMRPRPGEVAAIRIRFGCKEPLFYLANTPPVHHVAHMLNLVSLLVGALAFVVMLVGLIPLLGWLNWAAIPLAIIGAALGSLSSGNAGRNLNVLVIIVGGIRLWLGGFIL
jgi:hypothetical protein